jgi:hypothetical protein
LLLALAVTFLYVVFVIGSLILKQCSFVFQIAECGGHQRLRSGRKAAQPEEEEGGAKDEEEEDDGEARSLVII